jgi:hypothetical protein
MRLRFVQLIFGLLVAGTLGLAPAGPALAAAPAVSGPARNGIVAGMRLDCINMNTAARAYASQHGLCTGSGSAATATAAAAGNCGSSQVDFFDQHNAYWMTIRERAHSTLGPIASVYWHVVWSNLNTGGVGAVTGAGFVFSSDWQHFDGQPTKQGYVYGAMEGFVVLIWGAHCNFIVSYAATFVT